MRMIVLALFAATAIGLLGTANTLAAPVQGSIIGAATATTSAVTKAACVMRRVCGARGCAMRRVCG